MSPSSRSKTSRQSGTGSSPRPPPARLFEAIAKFGDVMSGKRKAPDQAQPVAKRLREETRLVPGLALPVTFHRFLHDLFRLDMECPLSLFTTSSLRYIATNAATLPTKKINAPEGVDKRPVVLDVGDFQKNVLDENNLDRGQWIEASKNFLLFVAEAQPERAERYTDHFAFFEQHQDGEDLFPAILKTDIKLRSQYLLSPFIFDVAFYSSHLQSAVVDLKIARARLTQPTAPLALQAPRLPSSAVLRVGRGPLLRGGGALPFGQAPGWERATPSASSALDRATRGQPVPPDPSLTGKPPSANSRTTLSSPKLARLTSAGTGTPAARVSRVAPTTESVSTSAPSVATDPITLSAGLANTKIFPNHPSTANHNAFVNDYLHEEVEAGHMSGPFSREKTESILKGHFQCSPIIIAVQPQGPGEPDKLRLCRHLSKGDHSHPSTNFFVDKDKFPTKFGTASDVAEIVSPHPLLCILSLLCSVLHALHHYVPYSVFSYTYL
ncbi:Reverse transcriptase/ribonuclease H [Mycena indigotica]|uniref:Reverse transcriptase/ribonuclease H n=1 Tax=Mycena indigotica TaxID=2126181 RepID=A0A8H6TCC9_9AGAR|nr:Reverse transcriptase/ribonuclease H [Mycena indigotica]KAF7315098.1 Reverse transcriptase/ribonuclease H [Mycena indigotica]